MLLEVLPHFARLVPVADKYLSSRTSAEQAHEAAFVAFSEEVRNGMGRLASEQESLRRQVQEQSAQLSELAVETTRVRLGMENVEARMAKLEKSATLALGLLGTALALLVVLIGMLALRRH
jgi:chromosome segregation ATPase